MTTITRLFDNSKNAGEAAEELKANKFAGVRLATKPADGRRNGVAGDPAPAGAFESAGFSPAEAETFAGAVKDGGAVLRVEIPFGRGRLAEQILDRHGASRPAPSVARTSARRTPNGDEGEARAAPLSSLLGVPVLTDPRPTTVGSLGDQRPTFPTGLLSSEFYVSRLFGLPLLTRSMAWASLIDDPAPLSRWLGLPVLLRSARPTVPAKDTTEGQEKPPRVTRAA